MQAALRRVTEDEREAWEPWWGALESAAATDAELTGAFAERARRNAGHPETTVTPPLHEHIAALRAAGFGDVGTVWQYGDDRVLVALR